MMGVKTIWELCLFQVEPFVSLQRLQMGIFVLLQKETGAERVAMATAIRVSFFSFVMHLCGAKFQEQCFNISRDVVYSVFCHFLVANNMMSSCSGLHNGETSISLQQKGYFRKKNAILLYCGRPFR